MAKWGAHSLTGGIARKLIAYDIVVNGIAPGTCLTSNPALPHNRNFEDNAYFQGQPSQRFTMPEEIAKTALFLTSGEAKTNSWLYSSRGWRGTDLSVLIYNWILAEIGKVIAFEAP